MTDKPIEVTEADREAAADYSRRFPEIRLTEAFARYRIKVEAETLERAGLHDELTCLRAENERLRGARNLAYGLLWSMQPVDLRNAKDRHAGMAREALLATMTKADQSDGITTARAALANGDREALQAQEVGRG